MFYGDGMKLVAAAALLLVMLGLAGPLALIATGTPAPPPGLALSPEAAADIAAGTIDGRVVAVLAWMAERHRIAVSVLRTGHSEYVAGTERVSNHYEGRAADIAVVDGEPVTTESQAARRLVVDLEQLPGPLAPSEIGEPWAALAGPTPGGAAFSDAGHRNHIHVGYGP